MSPPIATVSLSFLVLAAASCSSIADPPVAVSVLVTNGTCSLAGCDSLEVLAFPSNQPNTPAGFWSLNLGLLTGRQGCFTLQPSATFRVIGENADGSRDTTTFKWTTALPVSLGAQSPAQPQLWASPSTGAFVPDHASGWQITLPHDSSVAAQAPCTP